MLRIEEIVGAMDDEFRYALDALSDERLAVLVADKAALRRLRPVGVSHAEALAMIAAIQTSREAKRQREDEAARRKAARAERRKTQESAERRKSEDTAERRKSTPPRRKKVAAAPPPAHKEDPLETVALPAPPQPPRLAPPAAAEPAIRLPPPADSVAIPLPPPPAKSQAPSVHIPSRATIVAGLALAALAALTLLVL